MGIFEDDNHKSGTCERCPLVSDILGNQLYLITKRISWNPQGAELLADDTNGMTIGRVSQCREWLTVLIDQVYIVRALAMLCLQSIRLHLHLLRISSTNNKHILPPIRNSIQSCHHKSNPSSSGSKAATEPPV